MTKTVDFKCFGNFHNFAKIDFFGINSKVVIDNPYQVIANFPGFDKRIGMA